jgi:hypothetical protein
MFGSSLFLLRQVATGGSQLDGIGPACLLTLSVFTALIETFCDVSDNVLLPLQWALAFLLLKETNV